MQAMRQERTVINNNHQSNIEGQMPQKKFSFGITTGKGYLDLARFDPRKNGSIYLTPYPPFWGDTGFHASFHPNGTYFKTYKPLKTVFAGGNASSFVNNIRNHLQSSMRDLNLEEEQE